MIFSDSMDQKDLLSPLETSDIDDDSSSSNSQSSPDRSFLQRGATKIGLHSVKNILGDEKQISLFSNNLVQDFSDRYGIKLENSIDRFGVNLNDTQLRVLEAVLRGFTETNYQGNLSPLDKSEMAKEKYRSDDFPETYKHIAKIPRLYATQSQILEWGGFNKNSIAEKERAVEALNFLAKTQFCFMYNRLAYDEKGNPRKRRDGGWVKEEVNFVDTVLSIKEVRDPKTKRLDYYEIFLSLVFLDQMDGYFMLVPHDWREEVQKAIGKKKISSFTFKFLLYLRYEYELKRRRKQPLEIRKHWEDIAIAIKIPETVYKRKKERAKQILEEAYSIAKALGYLTNYHRDVDVDVLQLREEKYYNPYSFLEIEADVKPIPIASSEARTLFDFFYEEKKKLDPKFKVPMGDPKNAHLRALDSILKERSSEEVRGVIRWSLNKRFWCTQIASPIKLKEHFSNALSEMLLENQSSKEEPWQSNKKYAQELYEKIQSKLPRKIQIDILNQHVEIAMQGTSHVTVIKYMERGFREQLENALRKIGISFT